jgi:hypothetical protein
MYTLDTRGDLASVWLLTLEEAARRPLPKPASPPPQPQK